MIFTRRQPRGRNKGIFLRIEELQYPLEKMLHKVVAAWLDQNLPEDTFWTTFPSGGGGEFRGYILKDMGLKAGVPDILVWGKNKMIGIELKSEKGVLSKDQKIVIPKLEQLGFKTYVCKSLADVQQALHTQGFMRINH